MLPRACASCAVLVSALLFSCAAVSAAPVVRLVEGASRVPPNFNINCGGEAVGRFIAEDYRWIVGKTSFFRVPDAIIGGAEEKNLPMYKSHRYGVQNDEWGYDIPVQKPGVYGCTVHFAETFSEAFDKGSRIFNLTISTSTGEPTVFENIDVVEALNGAHFTAYTRTAVDLVATDSISFRVKRAPQSKFAAFMSGITCERTADLPSATGTIATKLPKVNASGTTLTGSEININCGFGALGRFRAEDPEWIVDGPTSTFAIEGQPIGGAAPENAPALWSHRYGIDGASFGYNIPVSSAGFWDCTLHFAETDSDTHIGDRVFDAQVQNQKAVSIDVLKELGDARFTSAVRTFVNVPIADALAVRLLAKVGNPYIAAITCAKKRDFTEEEAAQIAAGNVPSNPPGKITPTPSPKESVVVPSPSPTSGPEEPVTGPSMEPEPSTPGNKGTGGETPSQLPIGSEGPGVEPTMTPGVGEATPTALPIPSSSVEPAFTPTPSFMPTSTVLASTQASPSATVSASGQPGEPLQSPSSSLEVVADPSAEPSESAIFSSPEASAPGTSVPTSIPVPGVELDSSVVPGNGEVNQQFDLLVVTPSTMTFTPELKAAIKELSAKGSTVPIDKWSMTGLIEKVNRQIGKADAKKREYDVVMLAAFPEKEDGRVAVTKYTDFITKGNGTMELTKAGFEGATISLVKAPDTSKFGSTGSPINNASTTATSTIVAAVVGSLLGVFVIIALVALFVVQRHRRNEVNPEAFDAPPPAMTDSDVEGQSAAAPSETGGSVDYLDDDSTFTAATSRAGDPENGVVLDKDIWGRGSS